MNNLPEDILYKINDFRFGSKKYWKSQFSFVINQLNSVEFFCKTHWCSKECELCNECFNDISMELKFDDALKMYLNDYIGKKCKWCNCKIVDSKISFVNQKNYYDMLDYFSDSEDDNFD